jgi:hypothetical protein
MPLCGGVGVAAEPVSPAAPREEKGLYWGYTTRVAPGLKEALEQCPFEVSTRILFLACMPREFRDNGRRQTTGGGRVDAGLSDWGRYITCMGVLKSAY